jgi:hypothetical protein
MSEDMKLSKVVIHYADQRISELEAANAALKAENAKLREALKKTYRIADSWIQDQLQGTTFYPEANGELEPARKLLGIE